MKREDSANTLGGIIVLASSSTDDGHQNRNDFLNTQRSEGSQGNDTIDGALAGFKLLGEQRQEFIDDDGVLAITEVAHDGNGVFLGSQETRAANMVQQIGDGGQSGLFQFNV